MELRRSLSVRLALICTPIAYYTLIFYVVKISYKYTLDVQVCIQDKIEIAVIRKPVVLHAFAVFLLPLVSFSAQASEKYRKDK